MITPAWCQMMARYNAWQNAGIIEILDGMTPETRDADRGAFFGSITQTLNHLLWGDTLWISRLDGGPGPMGGPADSVRMTDSYASWRGLRQMTDMRIQAWADTVTDEVCAGDLTVHLRMTNSNMTRPAGLFITHFFNHQTHHRGQVHAMLTASGQSPGATDLPFMPEDA